jgi:hypothetical protein
MHHRQDYLLLRGLLGWQIVTIVGAVNATAIAHFLFTYDEVWFRGKVFMFSLRFLAAEGGYRF